VKSGHSILMLDSIKFIQGIRKAIMSTTLQICYTTNIINTGPKVIGYIREKENGFLTEE
jgi:hypothetical protein